MSRRVLPSYFPIEMLGPDVQRQRAARLLLAGFTSEGAAAISRLPLAEVEAIAETLVDEFKAPEKLTR